MKKLKIISLLTLSLLISGCNNPGNSNNNSSQSNNLSDSTSISEIDSNNSESLNLTDDLSSYYGGYYSQLISWTNGEDLKRQLQNIIRNDFNKIPYTKNWNTNQNADRSQTNFDYVDQVYTSNQCLKDSTYSSSNTSGYQREHAFCQSLMNHYVDKRTSATSSPKMPSITLDDNYKIEKLNIDLSLNNFYVTYTNGYQSKSIKSLYVTINELKCLVSIENGVLTSEDTNKLTTKLGTLTSESYFKVDENNNLIVSYDGTTENTLGMLLSLNYSYVGEGDNGGVATDFHNLFASSYNGNTSRGNKNFGEVTENKAPSDVEYKYDVENFEPSDKDKGKISRAIFYMDTMYDDLTIQENVVKIDQVVASGIGTIGNYATLLNWATSFSVDYHEYQHNISVYSEQKNRNPYVDFPGLIDFVYGSKKDQAGSSKELKLSSTQDKLKTNIKEYKNLAIEGGRYEYEVGDTFSLNDIEKIYTTYTDFTKEEIQDRSKLNCSLEDVTFSENDIGTKEVTISDGKTEVKYQIQIKAYDVTKDVLFDHQFTNEETSTTEKDLFAGLTSDSPKTVKLNDVDFLFTLASGAIGTTNHNATKGVAFGKTTASVGTLTIETVNDFVYEDKNDIYGVYLNTSFSANGSANITVYIGDTMLGTTQTWKETTASQISFTSETPLQGKIKIVYENVKGTVYLKQLSINVK